MNNLNEIVWSKEKKISLDYEHFLQTINSLKVAQTHLFYTAGLFICKPGFFQYKVEWKRNKLVPTSTVKFALEFYPETNAF